MADKALTRKRRDGELAQIIERVALNDARTCEDADRSLTVSRGTLEAMATFTDAELEAAGWTRRQFETACEARKPRSEAAYAIQLAHERVMAHLRSDGATRVAAPAVAVIVMPGDRVISEAVRKNAPIIDVGQEGE